MYSLLLDDDINNIHYGSVAGEAFPHGLAEKYSNVLNVYNQNECSMLEANNFSFDAFYCVTLISYLLKIPGGGSPLVHTYTLQMMGNEDKLSKNCAKKRRDGNLYWNPST